MDKLLLRYCILFNIEIADFKGKSHANGLPLHRHVFYYCVKIKFPHIKLKHISEATNKNVSGVWYGINSVKRMVTPIKSSGSKNLVTSEMYIIKKNVAIFLRICGEYKREEIKPPSK